MAVKRDAIVQGELAPAVAEFGLHTNARRVIELAAQYRAAQESTPERLQFAKVRAARELAHILLCEVVALISGTYHRHDWPSIARPGMPCSRPSWSNTQAAQSYLRRRPVVDIAEPADER